MDEELKYAAKNGHEFTTNLWCSFDGGPPTPVMYTSSEVTWAAEEFSDGILFVWDGMEPGLDIEWDNDWNLPMYTRDWLQKGFIEGYRIDGTIYHPTDVEVIHRGNRR